MNTKTTTLSNNKSKPPLWFWIALVSVSLISLTSVTLNLAKSSRLSIAAQENQKPLMTQRVELLKEEGIIKSNWLKTLNPQAKKIQGDLIWSTKQQKGMMRFNNLPKLGTDQSYHLWIYDLEYSIKEPISATRFQTEPQLKKDFLVEITPKKMIKKPYKFVLVIETKSQEKQILLLAQP